MSHHYSGPDWGFPRGDARLDLTDLYAFPKPGDSDKSILIMNVHPSPGENPPGPTTPEPFAAEALYEIKADTNADAVADIAYRVRFSSLASGAQTATLRRVEGEQARGMSDGGSLILEGAPVSTGREALVTEAGDYRLFAGWRSDPFFFDRRGALNNLQFTGADFFADKDVCGIVLEVPNSALQSKKVGLWYRTLVRADRAGGGWVQAERGAHPLLVFLVLGLSDAEKESYFTATRRMMRVSSPVSHTRWSTRVGIRRRKQHGWQRHCCRKSCLTTPRVPLPFPTMAGHSPTMPQMSS
jgi:hypothetical protein